MEDADPQHPRTDVLAALTVHVEPLAADARIAVVGDASLGIAERLLELGARSVHVYDPDPARVARFADAAPRGTSVRTLRSDFDVRDGAFDLVVVPDVGALPDPSAIIVRLRRILDARGAVVAMARARTSAGSDDVFPELAPAAVEYAELYDLFALQFESVTLSGVLPFSGVVFAELGAGDDLPVSVDTRLVAPEPPGVFVVVASRTHAELDPYAIVQVGGPEDASTRETVMAVVAPSVARAAPVALVDDGERARTAEAAYAAMQLRAELLAAQLDEHRARVASLEVRASELLARLDDVATDRDNAHTRATELEGILAAAQHALADLERRLVAAERGMLERDDQIAALNAELDAHAGAGEDLARVDPSLVAELVTRAERAEAALALHVADLAHVSEAHATETSMLEAQLRERARVISEMERELARREHMVRELVTSLEDARAGAESPVVFEAAPAPTGVPPEEALRLRRKLDELAMEVARRDGELQARAWRITELENALAAATTAHAEPPPPPRDTTDDGRSAELERALARARDEVDALRQALTQEHAARVAAESGEELTRARAELAEQAALLEQLRGRDAQAG